MERVRDLLEDASRAAALAGRSRPLRVVVAGHDFKFMTRLMERFAAIDELESGSTTGRARAARPGAEPGARRLGRCRHLRVVRPQRHLVCRAQAPGPTPRTSGCIASSCTGRGRRSRDRPGRPGHLRLAPLYAADPGDDRLARRQVAVIPNWVDTRQLDRPKLPDARFHLGMIGVGEQRKRFDLALDILEAGAPRGYRVHAARQDQDALGVPAHLGPTWRVASTPRRSWPGSRTPRPARRRRVRRVRSRCRDVAASGRLPPLDERRRELPPGPRRGHGVAGRAGRPAWPGADTTFDPMWVHEEPAAMAGAILATVEATGKRRRRARAEIVGYVLARAS